MNIPRFWVKETGRAVDKNGPGLTEWDIDRVVAHALTGNAASHRVMEKCGLHFEGRFTIPERILPGWTVAERQAVKYGMNRADFLGLQGLMGS